jgi:hypothetical protein
LPLLNEISFIIKNNFWGHYGRYVSFKNLVDPWNWLEQLVHYVSFMNFRNHSKTLEIFICINKLMSYIHQCQFHIGIFKKKRKKGNPSKLSRCLELYPNSWKNKLLTYPKKLSEHRFVIVVNSNPCLKSTRQYVKQITMATNSQANQE